MNELLLTKLPLRYRYADPEVSTGISEGLGMCVHVCAGGPTNITTKRASSCGYLRRPRPARVACVRCGSCVVI